MEDRSKKDPEISVVIPCFRAGELLAQAIESVLAQTETDWELILVDNNASDDTKVVISKYVRDYPEKIKSVNEFDQGVCSARNKGIIESKGKFIALLDDDDLFYPNCLAKHREAMTQSPDAVLSYSLMDTVSQDGIVIEKGKPATVFPHFSIQSIDIAAKSGVFLDFPEPMPSTVFFKKGVSAAFFDKHFNPFFLEDTDFSMRMFQVGKFIKINSALVRFRIPSTDYLRIKRKNVLLKYRLLQNQDYFYSKIIKILEKRSLLGHSSIVADLKRMRSRWLRESSFDFLTTEESVEIARLLLWRSIRENLDVRSLKHFIRSFFPVYFRRKKYGGFHVEENEIDNFISELFIKSIYKRSHSCEFCSASREGIANIT